MSHYKQFEYFDNIYNDRIKYNLGWAFDDAQKKIDSTYTKLCDEDHALISNSLAEAAKSKSNLSRRQKKVVSFAIQSRRLHNIFSHLQQAFSLVEIILSVLLVLIISDVAHQYEAMAESEILGLMVLIIFAFFKVFIEKGILQPSIEKWGWEAYHASYVGLFEFLEESHELREQLSNNTQVELQTLQTSTKTI